MFQVTLQRTHNFGLFYTPCLWGRFSRDLVLLDWVRASHSDKNNLHNILLPLAW